MSRKLQLQAFFKQIIFMLIFKSKSW